ncbi:DUF1559 domain-containing protein [Bremerella sp. JC817]|uniref:DUF1559 family PulG-like putative transporter n=1 Tax=Bremerella sp. JC817 TaxID=3231756 RepID=UPI00345A4B04
MKIRLLVLITMALVFLLWVFLPNIEMGRNEARQVQERLHLTSLAEAITQHRSQDHTPLPQGVTDSDGNTLLSWRVLILPELGHEDLFSQFDLSQPWDAPVNQKMISQMPGGFDSPFHDDQQRANGVTTYRIVAANLPKGNDAAIVVSLPSAPVIWTKPEVLSPKQLWQQVSHYPEADLPLRFVTSAGNVMELGQPTSQQLSTYFVPVEGTLP